MCRLILKSTSIILYF
uniref:Uncharacterized protein n=1 Tax=Arundo donax TaxID=35708 RepID=A0A0A9GI59_ARUDO